MSEGMSETEYKNYLMHKQEVDAEEAGRGENQDNEHQQNDDNAAPIEKEEKKKEESAV